MEEIKETAAMPDLLDNPEIPKFPTISGFPEKKLFFQRKVGKILLSFIIALLGIGTYFLLGLRLVHFLFEAMNLGVYAEGAIVYVAYLSVYVLIFWVIMAGVVGYIVFRQWWYAFLVMAMIIVILGAGFSIYSYSVDVQNTNELKKRNDIMNQAEQNSLEITDFQEEGEQDSEGYLKKLRLRTKINSKQDITIQSPFRIALDDGTSTCVFLDDNISQSKQNYTLKIGINNIEDDIELLLNPALEKYLGEFTGKLYVGVQFIIPFPTDRYTQDAGSRMTSVNMVDGLQTVNKCFGNDPSVKEFETKPYKLHL
jgi:hypothetical protein